MAEYFDGRGEAQGMCSALFSQYFKSLGQIFVPVRGIGQRKAPARCLCNFGEIARQKSAEKKKSEGKKAYFRLTKHEVSHRQGKKRV